ADLLAEALEERPADLEAERPVGRVRQVADARAELEPEGQALAHVEAPPDEHRVDEARALRRAHPVALDRAEPRVARRGAGIVVDRGEPRLEADVDAAHAAGARGREHRR